MLGSGGTPLHISGLTGSVIMKQEPHEGGGGTISLTPVSINSNGQVRPYLILDRVVDLDPVDP
jgi:hypothetical protein